MKFMNFISFLENKSTSEITAYHGNATENLNLGWKSEKTMFFATDSKKLACYYGKWVHKISFSLSNPLIIDGKGRYYSDIKGFSTDELGFLALKKGYDGVIFNNIIEGNYPEIISTVYIIFDTNKVKKIGSAKVYEFNSGGHINRFIDWETDTSNILKKYDPEILAMNWPDIPIKAF